MRKWRQKERERDEGSKLLGFPYEIKCWGKKVKGTRGFVNKFKLGFLLLLFEILKLGFLEVINLVFLKTITNPQNIYTI